MIYFENIQQNFRFIKRCLRLLSGYAKVKYVVLTIFQIITSIFDVIGIIIFGLLIKFLVDLNQTNNFKVDFWIFQLDIKPNSFQVIYFGALVLIFLLLKSTLNLVFTQKINFYLGLQQYKVSIKYIKKFLNSNLSLINKRNSASYIYMINNGFYLTITNTLNSLSVLLSETFLFFIIFSVLAFYNFYIAIAVLVYLILIGFYIQYLLNQKFSIVGSQFANSAIEIQSFMAEFIKGFREISVYNKQTIFQEHIDPKIKSGTLARAKSFFYIGVPKLLYEIFLIIGIFIFSIWTFTTLSITSALTFVGVFVISIGRLIPTLIRLNGGLLHISKNRAESLDFFDILEDFENLSNYQEIQIKTDVFLPLEKLTPIIEVRNLSFGYETKKLILNNVNLVIEPTQKIAVIGTSGSGKSTFFDLLLGFQKPTSGSILIGGLPPTNAIQNWPKKISYAPQQPFYLNTSIKQNIALEFEDSKINVDKIIHLIRELDLYDFIYQLPDKLETIIGENGFTLSGGQKHRLGIARALYSDPELLFLDEATNALDEITEKVINNYIYEKLNNKTIVTISHKFSTIKHSDIVYKIKDGELLRLK